MAPSYAEYYPRPTHGRAVTVDGWVAIHFPREEKTWKTVRRNVLYESVCMECNKEKLSDISGVDVGETARSIFERSKEHWSYRLSEKEDSHMIKHWQIDHPDLPEPPKFKFKVGASFQDALTRQVSEAVRIEC